MADIQWMQKLPKGIRLLELTATTACKLMAMGLFQFDGGSGVDPRYDITAPVFDKVTIRLSPKYYGGKTFTLVTKNQQADHVYIQSATWNGQPLRTCWLAHSDLIQGGTLELTLGAKPNKAWGKL